MSYAYLPDFVIEAWPTLSLPAKAMVVSLASFMNKDKMRCWPSIKSLSIRSGLKDNRSTRKALQELSRKGLLKIQDRLGTSCIYTFIKPPASHVPPASDATPDIPCTLPLTSHAGGPPPCDAPLTILLNNKNTPPPSGGRAKSKDGFDTWRLWVVVNRELGRRDPARLGPDLSAGKALGKLVASGDLDESELRFAMESFLQDQDSFLVKQGHPLRLIGGRINRYLEEDPKSEDLFDPQIAIELERKLAEEARAAGGAS